MSFKNDFPAQVEIRTINYIPSFGFYGIDVDIQSGIVFAEHYGQQFPLPEVERKKFRE